MDNSKTSSESKHTTIVYFHGMGNQRKFEELGRLIEALDRFSYLNSENVGNLSKIRTILDLPLSKLPIKVGGVEITRNPSKESEKSIVRRKKYKFYEAYWAHTTAGGAPLLEIVAWICKQILAPLYALITPWRHRTRLRRSILLEVWPQLKDKFGAAKGDLKRLVEYYNKFDRVEARQKYPKGSAKEFFRLVQSMPTDEALSKRMVLLARSWHRKYIVIELWNLFYISTLLISVLLTVLGLIIIIVALFKFSADLFDTQLAELLPSNMIKPTFRSIGSGALIILSAIGGTRFLKHYLGDVQFWATYEETSIKNQKRNDILNLGTEYLKHALRDPNCDRVVIIGHSLGTAIAQDVILELAQQVRALPEDKRLHLEKIRHFITIASPIDKIHYFFESHVGKYYRYNRIFEEFRGDIGTFPFSRNGQPLIRWINFWDRADIISGPLHTPCPSNPQFLSQIVDNVEVGSFFFPSPGKAHSAYFDNKKVIEYIYQIIFDNSFSYDSHPSEAAHLPAGGGERSTKKIQAIMIALPWLVLLFLMLSVLDIFPSLRDLLVWVTLFQILVLSAGFVYNFIDGHKNKLG